MGKFNLGDEVQVKVGPHEPIKADDVFVVVDTEDARGFVCVVPADPDHLWSNFRRQTRPLRYYPSSLEVVS